MQHDSLGCLRGQLGFTNCFHIKANGRCGGIQLWWKQSINLSIQSFSKGHVDPVVREDSGLSWRLSGIYGSSILFNKSHTWSLLRRLHDCYKLPWFCIEDFSQVLSPSEKLGGNGVDYNNMVAFNEALLDVGLRDLGFIGDVWTW